MECGSLSQPAACNLGVINVRQVSASVPIKLTSIVTYKGVKAIAKPWERGMDAVGPGSARGSRAVFGDSPKTWSLKLPGAGSCDKRLGEGGLVTKCLAS